MKVLKVLEEYKALNLSQNIDYDKFSHYSITHHSTSIEGSTLTEIETNLLLDEGITPKGKPLEHSLMTTDHANALQFVIDNAKSKKEIDAAFIQAINAKTMARTGKIYQTVFGELDSTQGVFRKGNVTAGGRYFPNFDKVELLTNKLANTISNQLKSKSKTEEQLQFAFDAHFDLVSIHPFYDGNGRTSRLLMNFILCYYNLPMAIVFKEDKSDYIEALEKSRNEENLNPFRKFMDDQYCKYLSQEINNFKKQTKDKGTGFSFVF
jgi:Fic family protein